MKSFNEYLELNENKLGLDIDKKSYADMSGWKKEKVDINKWKILVSEYASGIDTFNWAEALDLGKNGDTSVAYQRSSKNGQYSVVGVYYEKEGYGTINTKAKKWNLA